MSENINKRPAQIENQGMDVEFFGPGYIDNLQPQSLPGAYIAETNLFGAVQSQDAVVGVEKLAEKVQLPRVPESGQKRLGNLKIEIKAQ